MIRLGTRATCAARLRVRAPWLGLIALLSLGGSIWAMTGPGDGRRTALLVEATTTYGGLALGAVLVGGWLGDELHTGVAIFWIQMPRSLVGTYALRFAALAGLASALVVLHSGVVASISRAAGDPAVAHALILGLPTLVLSLLALCSLTWAVGGWGVKGDGWAAALLAIGLVAIEVVARVRPDWLGGAAAAADVVGLPVDDMEVAASVLTGTGSGVRALLRVLAWMAAWAVLGAVGIHVSGRRSPHPDRAG